MSWTAVNSLVWFRGLKLMSAGGLAVNVKGPDMVSRSWVPMATRVLLLPIKRELGNAATAHCAFLIKYVQVHLKSCPNYSSLSRPADVLMEFLLQLDEAVISLLCEGDVSQHRRHSVGSHRCRLPTAQTSTVIKSSLDGHRKLIRSSATRHKHSRPS